MESRNRIARWVVLVLVGTLLQIMLAFVAGIRTIRDMLRVYEVYGCRVIISTALKNVCYTVS